MSYKILDLKFDQNGNWKSQIRSIPSILRGPEHLRSNYRNWKLTESFVIMVAYTLVMYALHSLKWQVLRVEKSIKKGCPELRSFDHTLETTLLSILELLLELLLLILQYQLFQSQHPNQL